MANTNPLQLSVKSTRLKKYTQFNRLRKQTQEKMLPNNSKYMLISHQFLSLIFSPPKTWTRLQYLKKPGPSSPVTWRYSASLGFNRSGCRLFPGSSKLLELNEPDFWTSNKSTGRRQPSQDSPHEFLVVVFQPQAIWKNVRKSNFGSFFHHISEWTLNLIYETAHPAIV